MTSKSFWAAVAATVIFIVAAASTYYYYYVYTQPSVGPSPTTSPSSSPPQSQTPTILTDLNWGGYAVASDFNNPQPVITGVSGSWVVPEIETSQNDTFSAIWVGIGGTVGMTLIQAGTEQDCISGTTYYSAWFELLPSDSVTISTIEISPGDTINVSINLVDSATNLWSIYISDLSNGQIFNQNFVYGASKLSAEWIVERPNVDNSLSNLANFQAVTMTNCGVIVNGTLGNIGDFIYVQTLMTDKQKTPLVEVSNISDDGSSFSVKYLKSQ
jgi:hypothetical protein